MTQMRSEMMSVLKNKLAGTIIFLLLFSAPLLWSAKDYSPYPQPDAGYVTDLAGLLNQDEEEAIEQLLYKVEVKSKCEIIVVTIYSIKDYKGTPNGSIESFAKGLFDKYGIGNLPKEDGILLLIAKKDRKARIELGKYYGHSRDGDANRIMQNVSIPHFKKDQYAEGIEDGVVALVEEFTSLSVTPISYYFYWGIGILIAIIALSLICRSLFINGKKGWGWVCVGIIIILLLALLRIILIIFNNMPESSSSSWSPGGFGGFGGGSSGGGGATGSW